MPKADSWQAWRAASQARQRLNQHLADCRECRRWQGKTTVWIQPGRLVALPLCEVGTGLVRSWMAEVRRARALRSQPRRKAG